MAFLQSLPSLKGRRGTVARATYVVLALGAFAMTLGGLIATGVFQFRDQFSGMHYGIMIGSDDLRRPMIGKTWRGITMPGVAKDDRVAAIDGHAIGPDVSQFGVARRLDAAGPVLRLDLVGKDGKRTNHRIPRIDDIGRPAFERAGLPPLAFAWLQVGNTALVAAIFFTISLLLFRRRPRDPEAMLLATGFALMGLYTRNDAWVTSSTGIAPHLLDWLEASFGELGWWCVLAGLCAFPDGRFPNRWSRVARLLPTAFFLGSVLSDFTLFDDDTTGFLVELPIFGAIAGSLLLRYRGLPAGLERQQIKLVAFAAMAMVTVTAINAVFAQPRIADVLNPTASYLIDAILDDLRRIALPIGLLVSLLRYRLYDADQVITRSAGIAALTVLVVTVFACTEQAAQGLAQQYLGGSLGPIASGLGAAAAAIVIGPLHRRITDWSERRFRGELLALRDDLPSLVGDLREIATPQAIAEAAIDAIARSVRAQRLAIVVAQAPLAQRNVTTEAIRLWCATAPDPRAAVPRHDGADPMFPLRVPLVAAAIGSVGWLLLGPRPDGSGYGRDERETLAALAEPLARAFVVAAARIARDTEYDRRLAMIECHVFGAATA